MSNRTNTWNKGLKFPNRRMVKHDRSREPVYYVWQQMVQRCERSTHKDYPQYGGRGISVCARWRDSFEAFIKDMGDRPSPLHSIDRKENDGDYEPGNCRWAYSETQARNTSRTVLVEMSGRTQCLLDWVNELGLNYSSIKARINKLGWSPVEALTKNIRKKKAA